MAWVDVAAATDIADSYPIGFPKHLREDGRKVFQGARNAGSSLRDY